MKIKSTEFSSEWNDKLCAFYFYLDRCLSFIKDIFSFTFGLMQKKADANTLTTRFIQKEKTLVISRTTIRNNKLQLCYKLLYLELD